MTFTTYESLFATRRVSRSFQVERNSELIWVTISLSEDGTYFVETTGVVASFDIAYQAAAFLLRDRHETTMDSLIEHFAQLAGLGAELFRRRFRPVRASER